ncbi:hypothetical protein Holit_03119 [Hollandina sp. SP2]
MIIIQECSTTNINILANMNKQLIEDEKTNNEMDVPQLTERMLGFLNTGYKAFFIKNENKIIGYILCDMNKDPVYLRQFFIKEEERRKKYGMGAFNELKKHLGIKEIEIDVYIWNEIGIKFWKALGFKEQYIRMRQIEKNG